MAKKDQKNEKPVNPLRLSVIPKPQSADPTPSDSEDGDELKTLVGSFKSPAPNADLDLCKKASSASVCRSEESNFDNCGYETELAEGDQLINEITSKLAELGSEIDNIAKVKRDVLEAEIKRKAAEEERQRKAHEEEVLKRQKEAERLQRILEEEAKLRKKEEELRMKAVEVERVRKLQELAEVAKKAEEVQRQKVAAQLNQQICSGKAKNHDDIANGEARFKDSIHKGVRWNLCNKTDIVGVRFLCLKWDGFNLWAKCEKAQRHLHPLVKLTSEQGFLKLVEDLKNKFVDAREVVKVKEKVEEDKSEVYDFMPKIINSVSEEKGDNDECKVNDLTKNVDLSKYEVYSDDILAQLNAYCKKMMPQCGHTISIVSSDICLTICLKNTGEIDWPKGFKVKSLNTGDDTFESKMNGISIAPGNEIQLNVFIKNPKVAGDYTYIFGLVDIKDRRFGHEFEFDFKVKEVSNGLVWNSPFGSGSYWNNNYTERRICQDRAGTAKTSYSTSS